MPDYSKLHELMSHRIRIDYDTGAQISGYLASCIPGQGSVEFVTLANAELYLSDGTLVRRHKTLDLPANLVTGFALDEGPRGRDVPEQTPA